MHNVPATCYSESQGRPCSDKWTRSDTESQITLSGPVMNTLNDSLTQCRSNLAGPCRHMCTPLCTAMRGRAFPCYCYTATSYCRYGTRTNDRLGGLGVKASTSGAEDPGFESRLRRDFSGSIHTSELKLGTPVATQAGAWRYRVSTGTGRPGVNILCQYTDPTTPGAWQTHHWSANL